MISQSHSIKMSQLDAEGNGLCDRFARVVVGNVVTSTQHVIDKLILAFAGTKFSHAHAPKRPDPKMHISTG